MQISQMFKRKPCVFSIECFPPKQTANFGKMKDTLRTMRTLNPDFISVTYGAGGSTARGRGPATPRRRSRWPKPRTRPPERPNVPLGIVHER